MRALILMIFVASPLLAEESATASQVVVATTLEIWQEQATADTAVVLTSSEYGCRERTSRRYVLTPGGGRWILETLEAPRQGLSRWRLVDDLSGWSLQVEDREPARREFQGPTDFTRSSFWERAARRRYTVERKIRVSDTPVLEHHYEVIEGVPVAPSRPTQENLAARMSETISEPLLSRLLILHRLATGEAGMESGFLSYDPLTSIVGSSIPAHHDVDWHIHSTQAFRESLADVPELQPLLRAFGLHLTDDLLSGAHVDPKGCDSAP